MEHKRTEKYCTDREKEVVIFTWYQTENKVSIF